MDSYAMNTDYPQRQQHWSPHLLPPSHPLQSQPSFPSPASNDQHYAQYYQPDRSDPSEHRTTNTTNTNTNNNTATLSLNLSSLTVASPTNLSPINPPTSSAPSALSPVTPISPSANPFQQQQQHLHHHHTHHAHAHPHAHHVQSPFQFDPGSSTSPSNHYESNNVPPSPLPPPPSSSGGYDTRRTPAPSRSSSSSGIAGGGTSSTSTTSSQLPRKRSFTGSLNSTCSGPSPTSTSNPSSTTSATTNGGPSPNSPNHPTHPRNQQNQSQGLTVNVNLTATSTSTPTTLLEEEEPMLYDDEARDAAMELASSYDDMEVRTAYAGMHTHSLGTHGHHGLSHPSHGMSGMNFGGGGGGPGMGSGNAGNGSPVDGSGSTSGAEDSFGGGTGGGGGMLGMGGSMNILGKPLATNNFVTKLYQMINDPKSTQFIAWTELGTSFVVSNVGEFSRSILGSHFKHNNFSSFVRQLNMYGFHKINRTPRAQRTSTDAQTWEFSHHKFLRGRPDLLDEIKRKALEPDPAIKHRVELPGEVAAQLGAMREENRRMWDQLTNEKRKVEKLVTVVGRLWDVVGKGFPGSVPQFPSDLMEAADSPNIYIISPTTNVPSSRFPPPLSMNMNMMHSLNSPNSSPTASDFQGGGHYHHHQQHAHHTHHQQQLPHHHPNSLSRQHSFQQHGAGSSGYSRTGDSNSSTPLPSSPGSISMDLFDDGSCDPPPSGRGSTKRQRLDDGGVNGINSGGGVINVGGGGGIGGLVGGGGGGGNVSDSMGLLSSVSSPGSGVNNGLATLTVPKRSSRARSDSAPLGYGAANGLGTTMHSWQQQQQGGMGASGPPGGGQGGMGRPRSGSGMVPRMLGMGRNGNASTPLLSITTVESGMGGHPR